MNPHRLPRLLLPLFLLSGFSGYGQLLTESFDNPAFPPAGWRNANVNTDPSSISNVWIYASSAEETRPVASPHTGAGMALYDGYNYPAGDSAELVTPALDFSGGGQIRVKFWMYRDSRYQTLQDSLAVYVNTSQTAIGGTRLGVIYRHFLNSPAVAATGWYQYSFDVPAAFNGPANYIAFLAMSDYGTEMVIDDVLVEQLSGCSGTPDAGILSGPASICAGQSFTLLNSGATQASGMRYAWQSAPSASGPWSNLPAQTSPTQATVSQNSTTYYRFTDTCSSSGASAVSNVLAVTMNPFTDCYCKPPANPLHSFVDEYITGVSIAGTSLNAANGTDPATGYTQVPPTPETNTASLLQVNTYTINVTVPASPADPAQVSVWIDFNGNGSFDPDEFTNLSISGTTASGSISVPANSVTGPTGMRIRSRAVEFFEDEACTSFGSGETEDYTVTLVSSSALNGALVGVIPPNASCNPVNTVRVKLRNSGNLNIPAGAATVALYVTGANPQGPLTQSNSNELAPGDTATLSFNCSFPAAGLNVDSVFIQSLAGDVNAGDDTLVATHFTLPPAVSAPYAEDFEGAVTGWLVQQISGSGNWSLAGTVEYPDYAPPVSLAPKSGSTVALFDCYNYLAGTASRLTTPCINLPADAASGCGYVAGFYFTQDPQYLTLTDSLVILVSADGGNSFTPLGVVKRGDSTLSTQNSYTATSGKPGWTLYSFNLGQYAGQSIQLALDAYGNYGNQFAIDSFFVGPKNAAANVSLAGGNESGAALSPVISACTDAGGWTYYSDGNSARFLFGIQWDPSGSGANSAARAQATARINVNRKWYGAENSAEKMATYTLQRWWNVNLNGATLESPVNVRFFYARSEFDSIIAAKNNFIAANPGAIDEGFRWFKTVAGDFSPSPASVNFDSVVNDVELIDVNTGGATINGVLYAQFNGISSFSGGTATSGVGPTSPLPVGLLSFNAQRTGRVNKITWTTSQEINTVNFVVERSSDGRSFTAIGELPAAGNSASNVGYSFIDYTPARGVNFYRLRVFDNSGQTKFSPVRNVRNEGTADIALYPNPASDRLLVNINSDRADNAAVIVSDLNGRTLIQQQTRITEGMNYLPLHTGKLPAGTYVIRILLDQDMVIRKFNKL